MNPRQTSATTAARLHFKLGREAGEQWKREAKQRGVPLVELRRSSALNPGSLLSSLRLGGSQPVSRFQSTFGFAQVPKYEAYWAVSTWTYPRVFGIDTLDMLIDAYPS